MNEYASTIIAKVGLDKLPISASTTHLSKLAHLFTEIPGAEQLSLDPIV